MGLYPIESEQVGEKAFGQKMPAHDSFRHRLAILGEMDLLMPVNRHVTFPGQTLQRGKYSRRRNAGFGGDARGDDWLGFLGELIDRFQIVFQGVADLGSFRSLDKLFSFAYTNF